MSLLKNIYGNKYFIGNTCTILFGSVSFIEAYNLIQGMYVTLSTCDLVAVESVFVDAQSVCRAYCHEPISLYYHHVLI